MKEAMARHRNRGLWLILALLALFSLWYLFRPERAFLDKRVDEPLPATAVPLVLSRGQSPG